MISVSDLVAGEAPASRMCSMFDRAPIASLVLDAAGRIMAANIAAASLLGRPADALIGSEFGGLLRAQDRLAVERALGDVDPLESPLIERCIIENDPGAAPDLDASVAMSVWMSHLPDDSAVVQLVVTTDDEAALATIEQQRAFRIALLELSELAHTQDDDAEFYDTLLARAVSIVPGAQAGSILVHRPGTDEYHFVAASGFDLAALQTNCLYESEMFSAVETTEATINRNVAETERSQEHEEWIATACRINDIVVNVSAPVFVAGSPVAFISLDNFEDPDAFSATSVEMTTVLGRLIADLLHRRELEAALRGERESFKHQALHDELTGLANRRRIETALAEASTDSSSGDLPLAVFFVDIDDFKEVNDRFGHDAGDEVIVAVARALDGCTRPNDLVGRWGGDEFMVIARGIRERADVETVAHRVLSVFDDDIVLEDGRSVPCRLSIGAAWCVNGSVDADQLVQSADSALYEAKSAGKHTVRIAAQPPV